MSLTYSAQFLEWGLNPGSPKIYAESTSPSMEGHSELQQPTKTRSSPVPSLLSGECSGLMISSVEFLSPLAE